MLMKTLATILILVALLAAPLTTAQTATQKPVVIDDAKSLNNYLDLYRVEIDDNQTHLLIRIYRGSPLPQGIPSSSSYVYADV